ncbi:MAG: tRNA lysidine(34) synthetase TilS [Acetobacter sp.]|nr:tRNA lysidine(34) synthetase TilS [Acetobacter sp.]MCH4062554.1 tRNA lysidine(34) synthetase TilS [Acetobacter sp.]MCH4088600.1 tRNA lysidine(34) synthetase TilS [Acetobacter sp.]MCI1484189.1 tRNA lysidine(34) synthetase TilS [Acetobacter sp.]MCI1600288.1 tRNA lysidine(34) synthetase TilS [Acetobacter sp.]
MNVAAAENASPSIPQSCFAQVKHFCDRMNDFGPWPEDNPALPPVAMAISGGGDSMALAFLSRFWRRNLLALIVDHKLRPESTEEARLTAEWLEHLGIRARILTLSGLQKGSGLAARARNARYEALFAACREEGAVSLLVAHQADDQAETVAIRQRAGSGQDGLAAMKPITWLRDVCVIRPLLDVSRAALRELLVRANVPWVDDPSNTDLRSERVRFREKIREEGSQGEFLAIAAKARALRTHNAANRASELASEAAFLPEGWIMFTGTELPEAENLSALIRTLGGLPYPPSREAVLLLRARAQKGQDGTLAGCRLLRAGSHRFLAREYTDLSPAVPASHGASWDQRFVLDCPESLPDGTTIAAAGYGIARKNRKGWPAALIATLPALWLHEERLAIPHLNLWKDDRPFPAKFILDPRQPASEC